MKRRDFLRRGVAAGAFALVGSIPLLAAAQSTHRPRSGRPAPTPAGGPRPGAAGSRPFALEEATIAGLQERMTSGDLTSRAIVEMYLARIDQIDRGGPRLASVIEVNPDALSIADALDAERRTKGPRGPLHGIPILVKDNIDTADRMKTTAGSLALESARPTRDAFVIQRLRAAGAVVLGKANLSEWANFRSTRSTSGWSGRGGQCRNPYALDRSPCGSSSGSGASVAANLCAAAIGTETDGSIVCPSSTCGIVGIKPTVGLMSRAGIIPISHTQDTPGPMARTVADAAALLGPLTGIDPRDEATTPSRGRSHADYTRFLDSDALRGARIGVPRNIAGGFAPGVDLLFTEALEELKRRGATVLDPIELPNAGKYDDAEYEVLLYEFKADLNVYLERLAPGPGPRTLADLIAWNEAHRDVEMPFFGQEIFESAQKKGPLTSKDYLAAVAKCRRLSRTEGIDAIVTQQRLDALVAPTGGPAWTMDWVNGDHYTGGSSTAPAVSGYPNVTVPMGDVFGLPIGISFFGRAWTEPRLIAIAYAYEQATHHRRPPRFAAQARVEG